MEQVLTAEAVVSNNQPVSALIADDREYWTVAIKECLQKHFPSVTRITVVGTGAEALSRAISFKPDLIFLDIKFDRHDEESEDGIDIAGKIWKSHPHASIIIVSSFLKESFLRRLCSLMPKKAAYGYLLKENILTHFKKLVTTVMAGDCFMDPEFARVMNGPETPRCDLTHGEFQALVCAALGYTDSTSGKLLHVGERAIQARLRNVYAAFGIPDRNNENAGVLNPRSRAVWMASQQGLFDEGTLKKWCKHYANKAKQSGIKIDLH